MTGIELIAAERKRQIEVEGYTPDHDIDRGATMDRAVLIARLRDHGCNEPLMEAAASALEADAKKAAALKALCDDLGIGLARLVSGICAIYGWNATTKDLHTQTTKGDT